MLFCSTAKKREVIEAQPLGLRHNGCQIEIQQTAFTPEKYLIKPCGVIII